MSSTALDKRPGFTLLEILIAVLILGVILSLGAFSFNRMAPKYQLMAAAREIHSQMNYARYRAVFSGTRIRIRFFSNGYSLESFDHLSGDWIARPRNFIDHVWIEANNTPTFHPLGTVSNLASIYISNSSGRFRISLAISGRIRVQRIS